MNDKQWYEVLARAADGKQQWRDPPVPHFPDAQLQINTTGAAGAAGLPEVWQFYLDCRDGFFEVSQTSLGADHKLLDFGCGWGRISRLFLKDIGKENIFGTDVNPDLVSECTARFETENFATNNSMPPTECATDSFDLIVGFSVFSHLSEAACKAWMLEFARICRPGGLIALTTRGRGFFDFARSLAGRVKEGSYQHALSRMFSDFDAAIASYEAGNLVHSNADGVTGGGVLSADFYGETFIPQAYAETAFGPSVKLVRWCPEIAGRRQHPVMLFTPTPSME